LSIGASLLATEETEANLGKVESQESRGFTFGAERNRGELRPIDGEGRTPVSPEKVGTTACMVPTAPNY